MKYYSYYPGCSMEATGAPVEKSIQAIAKPLDIELIELEDWTCCGSSPFSGVDKARAVGATARVLAQAEKTGLDLVTPCSSCYTILQEANDLLKEDHKLADRVHDALSAAGLTYNGTVKVRHIVEVLYNDIGVSGLAAKVVRPLTGLKVACYHGCQQVRPDYGYDDSELPDWLDQMAKSLGAEPVDFPLKARCCGSSLVISESDVAVDLIHKLLQNAQDHGAQCMVTTTCPLCHTALDVYQSTARNKHKARYKLPALAITQLIAVAIGLDYKQTALAGNVVSPKNLLAPYFNPQPKTTAAETAGA
ncbi:MAG: CoB--CoM heterodisulfide reductase iron-sulfur subunit B family protein [Dehalococcoidia bacterium]|nr:CoB--CoM heterodisulfide reductase iron-sulfur subunit B family protein [Dehalococcoidia bacterium]